MRLVILESPYRGEIERNLQYAIACVRDSICRGESPYASHLIIPGALNDADPIERDIGIRCGYAWWRAASAVCFYTDFGWSAGMRKALQRAKTMSIKVEERSIANNQNTRTGPTKSILI